MRKNIATTIAVAALLSVGGTTVITPAIAAQNSGSSVAAAAKSGTVTKSKTPAKKVMKDIAKSPFKTEIEWLVSQKISEGWADGTFRPTSNVDRGAMAAFLYRLAGSPAYTAPAKSAFKDVKTKDAFYKEIHWLKDQGVTNGYKEKDGKLTFRANKPIERGAMAAFLYRYAGEPAYTAPATSQFKDVKPGTAFYKEIHWLKGQGITAGFKEKDGKSTFRANKPVTREVMAAFLYRLDKNLTGTGGVIIGIPEKPKPAPTTPAPAPTTPTDDATPEAPEVEAPEVEDEDDVENEAPEVEHPENEMHG